MQRFFGKTSAYFGKDMLTFYYNEFLSFFMSDMTCGQMEKIFIRTLTFQFVLSVKNTDK